jgi:hypothetical protein
MERLSVNERNRLRMEALGLPRLATLAGAMATTRIEECLCCDKKGSSAQAARRLSGLKLAQRENNGRLSRSASQVA